MASMRPEVLGISPMRPTLTEGFNNPSLRGSYAVMRIGYGGQRPSAAVGVYDFDGDGRWTGTIVANVPGPVFASRAQVRGTIAGTYQVDADGSGYGSTRATATFENGATQEFTTTLLITKAEDLGGVKVAQEVSLMEDAVDPLTGSLHMNRAIRYPDGGAFSVASLHGTFGGTGIGRGGSTPAAAIGAGAVNFHGDGSFTEVYVQNLPGTTFAERRNATFDTEDGRYTVNADGTGLIIGPGGPSHLVITRARIDGGVKVCLEYFFVTDDLLPATGNLVTTTVSKRLP